MFQWFVVIATVVGSNIFACIYKGRQRNVVMPLSFMFTLLALAVLPSIGGPFHAVYICLKFIVWMLALNGLPQCDMRNNPTFKAFCFFYLYMYGIGFTGLYVLEMSAQYLNVLLCGFGVGYFLAAWAVRTDGGMSRLLTAATIAGVVAVVHRVVTVGLSSTMLDAQGREMTLDAETGELVSTTGVNGYALNMMTLLPFVLIPVLEPMGIKCRKWVRWCAAFASLGIALLAIRTGSRNGCLGLIPCVLYALASAKNANIRVKRVWMVGTMGVVVFVATLITMGGAEIRAFNFSTQETKYQYGNYGDALTSGRFSLYERVYDGMTLGQRIWGAGYGTESAKYFISKGVKEEDREYVLAHRTRVGATNHHSIYVTIFFRTGVIGSILFLVFLVTTRNSARKLGERGKLALMFLGVWLITGLGESAGMTSVGNTALLAGFGMGLLNLKRALNCEFCEWRHYGFERPLYRM